MHAQVLTRHGGPEAIEWHEDWPDPEPGPDEVLIRVGATAINNTDIWTREGRYGAEDDTKASQGWRREPFRFPRIQGADVAGHVVAVGEGVAAARVGERVLVNPVFPTSEADTPVGATYLGSEHDGGFAELCVVPARNAIAVKTSLTDAELATFPTAYLTALHMLNRARLGAGETVLITGASGGVGTALVQLAKARGALVVAVVGRGKEDRARDLGADAVVPRDADDLAAAMADALAGRSLDVAADVVGGPRFRCLLNALAAEGRYVTAGAIAGPEVSLDLRTLYVKHLELIGSTLGTRAEFETLVGHIASGRLKPLLAAIYPLHDLPQAQADFLAKGFFGKLVVAP